MQAPPCTDEQTSASNAATLTSYCTGVGGPSATVFTLCAAGASNTVAMMDLCNGFVASTGTQSAAARSTIVTLCTDIGYDTDACDGAADAMNSLATCDDLVAAGPGICSSLADAVVVDNAQNLGCTLLGDTIGDSVGMASRAIRAFEQEANLANVVSVCRYVPRLFCAV